MRYRGPVVGPRRHMTPSPRREATPGTIRRATSLTGSGPSWFGRTRTRTRRNAFCFPEMKAKTSDGAQRILKKYYRELVKRMAEEIIEHKDDFESLGPFQNSPLPRDFGWRRVN